MRRFFCLLLILCGAESFAYDFVSDGMAFSVTDAAKKEVVLEYDPIHPYVGDFVIPATATNGNVTYKVVGTGFMCFYASTITSITFGENQIYIGDNTFYGCNNLTKVSIPDRIKKIGGSAFMYCANLEEVTLPATLTAIPEYAFNSCTNLRALTIPDGVTDVAYASLAYCENLEEVVIGYSVQNIGKQAFFKSAAKRIVLRTLTPPTAADDAFPAEILNNTELIVPETALNTYMAAPVWSSFANITGVAMDLDNIVIPQPDPDKGDTDEDNKVDELYYRITSTTKHECAVAKSVENPSAETPGTYAGDIVIPEKVKLDDNQEYTVTSIDAHAFERCYDLHSVVMPNTITTIGESAFWGCYRSATEGLTTITMSDGLRRSGSSAFYGCGALKSVHIGDLANWCTVTFDDARANPLPWAYHLIVNDEEPSVLRIPDGVTEIKDFAFYNILGRSRIEIPAGVRTIGYSAFCFAQDVKEIVLGPDVEYITYGAFFQCPAITDVYCQGVIPPGARDFFDYEFDYDVTQTATLHVPAGTRDAYSSANLWGGFKNIVEEIPDGLGSISAHSGHCTPVYDLQGRRILSSSAQPTANQRRIYIEGNNLRLK